MDLKWSVRGKDKELPKEKDTIMPPKESDASALDDYRSSAKLAIEMEVRAMIEEEIRSAAKELAEEQGRAVREAIEEHKRIIRDVLEQEKLDIRAQKEEIRASIIRLGMG